VARVWGSGGGVDLEEEEQWRWGVEEEVRECPHASRPRPT
jgi:hypothetical protein